MKNIIPKKIERSLALFADGGLDIDKAKALREIANFVFEQHADGITSFVSMANGNIDYLFCQTVLFLKKITNNARLIVVRPYKTKNPSAELTDIMQNCDEVYYTSDIFDPFDLNKEYTNPCAYLTGQAVSKVAQCDWYFDFCEHKKLIKIFVTNVWRI